MLSVLSVLCFGVPLSYSSVVHTRKQSEGSRVCVAACRANLTRYNVAANESSSELAASYAEKQEIMATTDSTMMFMQMFKEIEQQRLADRREAEERMDQRRREAE